MQRFSAALQHADGVAGAHCVHELCMRAAMPANIESALAQLWNCAAQSIPEWLPMRYIHFLPQLYATAAQFRSSRRGRSNVRK